MSPSSPRLARSLLAALGVLSLVSLHAQPAGPRVERYQAGAWEDDYGYRQAVRVGNTLYIAGCTGGGAMPDAIRTAYTKLKATLDHYGLTFADVVKETIYTTKFEELKANRVVRREFYAGTFPASTWIQIDQLFAPDYCIEVETIAIIPDGATVAATDPKGEITALLTEFLAKNSDPAQHARFWADDLVYTSSRAEVFGKAHIMQDMAPAKPAASKPPEPDSTYSAEDIIIRPYGTAATLTFRLVEHEPDGHLQYYRNSGTLLFRHGQWQVVTWQATKEPAAEKKS
jgi:enamine deaminase RidA (YjgF/YER057c/UK114 family)